MESESDICGWESSALEEELADLGYESDGRLL
jgi:hypothetical protein